MTIGGRKVFTDRKLEIRSPHEHSLKLGTFCEGSLKDIKDAVGSALAAKKEWSELGWEHRASIFLKAADLIAGPYRFKINAATMLCQSKNAFQAEIDSACELIDFLRFNAYFMQQIYEMQPESSSGIWNRMDYRPLEGFVFAITPFNFTAIAGNLAAAPAMMGNTVVWKPAYSQIYSAQVIMEVLEEAGLPNGVINLIFTDGPETGNIIFNHPDFAGLHFTGSTSVFKTLWKTIGSKIDSYKSYPKIVGETGGKDFVVAHESANPIELATALGRGAFEFQGQKCSAASRAYIPKMIWDETKERLIKDVKSMKMGSTEDLSNYINAVIDRRSFDKISKYIASVKDSKEAKIIIGGDCDDSVGYFISPTVILTENPHFLTMEEELFGPVLTIYVYEEESFDEVLQLVNNTSPYALTGSVFAKDRYIIDHATKMLSDCAGNFYINDKPTGAVVGQQPFGGGRGSGTNDKAGALMNLLRWTSPRTIKETFVPPKDYRYPFLN